MLNGGIGIDSEMEGDAYYIEPVFLFLLSGEPNSSRLKD